MEARELCAFFEIQLFQNFKEPDLLDVPDDELTPEDRKVKRKQMMLRAAAVRREQIRAFKEKQRKKVRSSGHHCNFLSIFLFLILAARQSCGRAGGDSRRRLSGEASFCPLLTLLAPLQKSSCSFRPG